MATPTGIIPPSGTRKSWGYVIDLGPQPRAACDGCSWRQWQGRQATPRACPRCGGAVVVEVGRRQERVQRFATRGAAVTARAEGLASLRDGTHTAPSSLTLGDYLRGWLDGRPDLRANTRESYATQIERHIIPRLGHVKLQMLGPDHVGSLLADLSESGRLRPGKPGLAVTSVVYVRSILVTALSDAMRRGLIGRNPAALARAPKMRRPKLTTWSPEQVTAFLDSAREAGDRLAPLWHAAAWTGARRGELLALTWPDLIDLDGPEPRVRIARSLRMVRWGKATEGPTKTDAGEREIPLSFSPSLVDALRRLRAEQAAERLRLGPGYRDGGYLFARPDGTPLSPEKVSGAFLRSVERSGLPRLRLHDLRHSFASTLLGLGVDVATVASILGHASALVTVKTYGHPTTDGAERAASLVAERLRRIV